MELGMRVFVDSEGRTLAQLVPIAGGAIAQAWSECESFQRNARINKFFAEFAKRIEALEGEQSVIKERIKHMEDFTRLLEDIVDVVRRESNDRKRELYPTFFVNLILHSLVISPDERSFLLDTLDYLTEQDLAVLRKFEKTGMSRGDAISDTTSGEWAALGDKDALSAKYEKVLTPFLISTAKLEARGIIFPVPNPGGFSYVGTGGDWYNLYRGRAWRLMPVGRDLLNTLSPHRKSGS
jgi:hypothetical protein